MSVRATIVVAVLTLAVALLVWLDRPSTPEPRRLPETVGRTVPEATIPNAKLLDFDPRRVRRITLTHGDTSRTVRRTADGWSAGQASDRITEFLDSLTDLTALGEIDAPPDTDPAEYGLNPPRSVVELDFDGDRPPLRVAFGDRNPAATGLYVRVRPDGPVAVTGAVATWEFEKAFRALADAPPE